MSAAPTDPIKKPKKRRQVTRIILENEASPNPLSPIELAYLTERDVNSIYRVMSRLRREGRIKGGHGPDTHMKGGVPVDHEALARPPEPIQVQVVAAQEPSDSEAGKAIDAVVQSRHMSKEEQLVLLTKWARSDSPMVSMKAIEGLNALQRGLGTHIGPPEPLTDDDRAQRLAQLMRGCGLVVVNAALFIAFPPEAVSENTQIENSFTREEFADGGGIVGR